MTSIDPTPTSPSTSDLSRRVDLAHAVDAVAHSLHTSVLRTSTADDLFVQIAAAAVIRVAEPHLIYRYNRPDADMRRRLDLTIGDWTITSAAVDAAASLIRRQVAGMAATDAQIQHAAVSALRAALNAEAA